MPPKKNVQLSEESASAEIPDEGSSEDVVIIAQDVQPILDDVDAAPVVVVVDPEPEPSPQISDARINYDHTPTTVVITTTDRYSINGAYYTLLAGKSMNVPEFVAQDLIQNGLAKRP